MFIGIFPGGWLRGSEIQTSLDPSPEAVVLPFISFEKTDIRVALSWLFQKVPVGYRFDPKVSGLITLSARDIPFEVALQQMTRQIDLTYRVEGGVYEVVPREGVFGKSYPELKERVPIDVAYERLGSALMRNQSREIQEIVNPKFTWDPLEGKRLTGSKALRRLTDFARQVHDYKMNAAEIHRFAGKVATEVQIYGSTTNYSFIASGLFCDTWTRAPGKPWRLTARVEYYPIALEE